MAMATLSMRPHWHAQLEEMTTSQLKQLLKEKKISAAGCVEKEDSAGLCGQAPTVYYPSSTPG